MAEINLLSFVAIITAGFFSTLIQQRVMSKRDKQNVWTILVLVTLAWWNICDAFFYVAQSKEAAWMWHRLGAPGWCGFIAVTGYYFLVFTGIDVKMNRFVKAVYWLPPVLLTFRFMFFNPSPMAGDLIQSTSGMGWTFVQRFDMIWTFLYLFYLLIYMGGALLIVYFWEKKLTSQSVKLLARGFLILDTIVVAIGFVSIFLMPYFTPFFPPAGCVATLIFGIWYWGWLRDYDFLYVELALNPSFVFETCIDAMLVTDDNFKILYANQEAKKLLDEESLNERSYMEFLHSDVYEQLETFALGDSEKAVFSNMDIKNGLPVICSITKAEARRGRFKVYIICLKEISELRKAQEKLDYMAHYDELTGLVNRRRLGDSLKEWELRYAEQGEDFEMIFLDLSKFKKINDTFGHAAGDRALIAVAEALQETVEPEDILARFAGDEFVLLHKKDGREKSVLMKKAVQKIDCSSFAPGVRLDIDIGCCRYSEAECVEDLYRIADRRMYESKKRM